MPEGAYELGIDIGTSSIVAGICRPQPGGDGSCSATFSAALASALAAWSSGCDLDEADVGDLVPPPTDLLERVGDPTPVRMRAPAAAAADVVAGLVRLLVDRATAAEGRAPAATAVAVPPSWGGHRRAALTTALRAAGIGNAVLVSAAVAAVRAHVDSGDLPADATAVVVDIGAATTDVAVVGPREDGELDHRAAPPAALDWGGRDVDDAVLRHVRRCVELPTRASSPADRARAVALRAACTVAKEATSLQTEVQVEVDPAWSPTAVRLTREELEGAVTDDVERVVATAVDAVAAAGTTAHELTAVVLTGGASRMPLLAERLSDALGVPLYAATDPALTSALGAAGMAADPRDLTEGVSDGGLASAAGAGRADARADRRRRADRTGTRRSPWGGRTTSVERPVRTPARLALVAALFLLIVVGPSVALTLVGAGPGVATDGTAAAGDETAPGTGTGPAGAPDTAIGGAAQTSNAGHEVAATSTTRGTTRTTSGRTTSTTGSTRTSSTTTSSTTPGSTKATTSSAAIAPTTTAATAAAPVTGATTPDPTTPGTTSTNPPATTTSDPPPATTSEPPPPATTDPPPAASSSAPAPVPDPPTSSSSTGTSTSSDTPAASAPASSSAANSTEPAA